MTSKKNLTHSYNRATRLIALPDNSSSPPAMGSGVSPREL